MKKNSLGRPAFSPQLPQPKSVENPKNQPLLVLFDNNETGCLLSMGIATLLVFLVLPPLQAQTEAIHKLVEPKPNVAAASLASYLERVRAENSNGQPTSGSIWIDNGRLTRISTDVRAMRP